MDEKRGQYTGEARESKQILSSYAELSELTGICIPNLRPLVNRRSDPLPSVRVSDRKLCFVVEDVLRWFHDEAERQAGNTSS